MPTKTYNAYLEPFTLTVPFEFKSWESNPPITKVIFNDPATIVLWEDGTKTVVKCQDGDIYSKELGLAMCISKKYLGNKGNFNNVFKKWIPDIDKVTDITFNIDVTKIGECARRANDAMDTLVKSLKNNTEPADEEKSLLIEALCEILYEHCSTTLCEDCKIPKEDGSCKTITDLSYEELLEIYKKIKEED